MNLEQFLQSLVASSPVGVAAVVATFGSLIFAGIELLEGLWNFLFHSDLNSQFKRVLAAALCFVLPPAALIAYGLSSGTLNNADAWYYCAMVVAGLLTWLLSTYMHNLTEKGQKVVAQPKEDTGEEVPGDQTN